MAKGLLEGSKMKYAEAKAQYRGHVALISMLTGTLTFVLGGIALKTLWLWFAVPLGVPAISFWHAMGLNGLVAAFRFHGINPLEARLKQEFIEEMELSAKLVNDLTPIFFYALALGFGWLCHYQM